MMRLKYFIHLAENVTHMLSIVGYELCPAEMMASNPLWCKSEKSGRNNILLGYIALGERRF
jgi:CBS domain-containing protein